MSTLAEFMILSGGDNRPPMLEKHLTRKYEELSATKKIQANCDLKATNIILQGLPLDVYSLVNHHRVAKDLWERVQLLMQVNQQTHLAEFPQIDSSLAVPVFKQGDDPIDAINKIMPFMSTVITSCFLTTKNQLRNSSNPRQQVTIHDGKVTVQPIQGRKFICCWSHAQGSGKVLNEEELEFLADPGVAEAKAVLMANLSSYGSDVLSEYLLEKQNVAVQDINSSAQQDAMILSMFEQLSNQVTNCNKVNKDNLIANESLSAELERYKERFVDFEKELLTETFNVLKMKSKEKEIKNIDKEIALEKKVKELDNIVYKMDIVNIVVNSSGNMNTSVNVNSSVAMNDSVNYVENCNKCLKLEDDLIKQQNMVEKDEYNRLSKSFSKLEQHCISLELAMQLNKEIFQKNNPSVNQTKPTFDHLFELNNLKAKLQAKDTTIKKLMANIKRLNKTSTTNSVKKDIDEIENM
ncbi:hypothetical protein Tco_0586350 [Tanacetum coccineum]